MTFGEPIRNWRDEKQRLESDETRRAKGKCSSEEDKRVFRAVPVPVLISHEQSRKISIYF